MSFRTNETILKKGKFGHNQGRSAERHYIMVALAIRMELDNAVPGIVVGVKVVSDVVYADDNTSVS